MRLVQFVCAGVLVVGGAGSALAQSTPPPPAAASSQAVDYGPSRMPLVVSGFVGSNFGATGDSNAVDNHASFEYGGQFAYLWNGYVGAEFIGAFAPSFKIESPFSSEDHAHVATYMANAIVSAPIGPEAQYQPYASGGFGGMSIRATLFTDRAGSTANNTQSTWGWNVGGGLMAFSGNWGFRADGRYYRAPSKTVTGTAGDQFTENLLSDLAFWRTSVGVAYRW
jgi:hypothetical protein